MNTKNELPEGVAKMPIINIEGCDFIVDVAKFELREQANPKNTIDIFNMDETDDGYAFNYSPSKRNLSTNLHGPDTVRIEIPELVVLDPEGMSRKYNVPDLNGKTDYDLRVNPEAFSNRVDRGMLPTIQIEGHTFYVDIRMDMIRPKDDFISNGIRFSEIENFLDEQRDIYIIPYNPYKREFTDIDYETITEIPPDLVVIEIPSEYKLDPIGWNRLHGYPLTDGLKEVGLPLNFVASRATWDDIYVPQKIKENLESMKNQTDHPSNSAGKSRKL